ncbi:MAG: M48 family metalloprotease [Phycisphaerales bacterium]|nr:M48 family metalloprotease [Phycisphaerales bacterium]
MTHLLIIAVMIVAAVRELAPEPLAGSEWVAQHPGLATLSALGPFAGLILLQIASGWACIRAMDRRGEDRAILRHERLSARLRAATLPAQASAVLIFGWLDLVRSVTGDLVAIDEIIAALPALAVLLVSWGAAEPVERRIRESVLIRRLDEGLSVPPMPKPVTWWWGMVRAQLLFAAVPVVMILAWSEWLGFVRDGLWERSLEAGGWDAAPPAWAEHAPAWLLDRDLIAYGSAAVQIGGVLVVLSLLPIALRYLWDTVPLGPGPARRMLLDLCARYRVRVRAILVWRTHGAMVNGAVVGFLPRLRYIVLTDALLESLPADQVEAVAAHEIAHVRHRHIAWLGAGMMAAAIFFGSAFAMAMRLTGLGDVTDEQGLLPAATLLGSFALALLLFGWISRRFEWQADAFAAKHITGRDTPGQARLTEHGARAMSDALRSVALINGMPAGRFTFRHGSIDDRRRRLAQAVDAPLTRLPADLAARRAKRLVVVLLVAGAALATVETIETPPAEAGTPAGVPQPDPLRAGADSSAPIHEIASACTLVP